MDISPNEAEEALDAIQVISQKTRYTIASSGVDISLIITGLVWMFGFTASQLLQEQIAVYIWISASIIGAILGTVLSIRKGRRVRSTSALITAKRIGTVWLLLAIYCLAALAVTWPLDGQQVTVLIVLFILVGWMAMGLLLSVYSVWPGIIIFALVIIGYFFVMDYFYLWMAILGGGGLIAMGLYIRYRW
jgi:hypothetical protein